MNIQVQHTAQQRQQQKQHSTETKHEKRKKKREQPTSAVVHIDLWMLYLINTIISVISSDTFLCLNIQYIRSDWCQKNFSLGRECATNHENGKFSIQTPIEDRAPIKLIVLFATCNQIDYLFAVIKIGLLPIVSRPLIKYCAITSNETTKKNKK